MGRRTAPLGKRFKIVLLCNIKSYFVKIDPRVLYGTLKEVSSDFDVSNLEFTGENLETHWKHIFDFKRLKMSKKKVFKEMIESDGVSIRVDYRCLKVDGPVLSSTSRVTKRDEMNDADPTT